MVGVRREVLEFSDGLKCLQQPLCLGKVVAKVPAP